jgi:hypothetical protein
LNAINVRETADIPAPLVAAQQKKLVHVGLVRVPEDSNPNIFAITNLKKKFGIFLP